MKIFIQLSLRITGLIIILTVYTSEMNAQWIQTNSPPTSAVYCFTTLGSNLFAGTENGLFLSKDSGQSWTIVFNNGFPNGRVYSLAASDSNLFAGTKEGVFLSSDSGRTWDSPGLRLSFMHIQALAISGMNLFAGTIDSGAYRSTDNGMSWTSISDGLPALQINALIGKDTNLFVIAATRNVDNASIYLSTNNGTKWVKTDFPDTCSALTFAVSGTNLYAGTNKGIFLSANNGTSWISTNTTGMTNTIVISLAIIGKNIIAGTLGGGVLLSTNGGTNWKNVSYGLSDSTIKVFMISGFNICAGSYDFTGGIWRRPLSEMINTNSVSSESLSSITLEQNIPNPFKNSTTIHYSIPNHEHVRIILSNMLGEKFRTLVDEDVDAGEHHLTINTNELPSGMYLMAVNAGGQIKSEKIIIEK